MTVLPCENCASGSTLFYCVGFCDTINRVPYMVSNIGMELNLAVGEINHMLPNFILPTFNASIKILYTYTFKATVNFVGIMFFIRNFQTWNAGGWVITISHYNYIVSFYCS